MKCIRYTAIAVPLALFAIRFAAASPGPIFDGSNFTGLMAVIDYASSPAGAIVGGTSITNQYAALGVLHDGSTTTPPGPSGISSLSGLPGLESNAADPDPNLPISINFTVPVSQVGAFYLMGSSNDSITFEALRANNSLIQSVTVAPVNMPLRPGPFGFNEGFIGLITNELIASVRFSPSSSPFVIDDLHFGVPEPSSIALCYVLALFTLARRRR